MTIKIEKGTETEKALKAMLEQKQKRRDEFRKAVQDGNLDEYAEKQRFAQPVSVPKP